MEFVLIPAGEFMMGAVPQDKEAGDDEKPQHKVRITKPFIWVNIL
jgi:formylglycine-generating enzyme required for sulfatase activity